MALFAMPAVAQEDALGEEFFRVREAVSGVLENNDQIDPGITEALLAQVTDLNNRALLAGKLEGTAFFPSLYLALLGCESISSQADMLEVQDNLLPSAIDQALLFSEVYLQPGSFVMRDSDQIDVTLDHLEGCFSSAVKKLEDWVYDPAVSMRFRQFRHSELEQASFWEGLRRLTSDGVLDDVPIELQPFMTATPTPVPQPTPTPVPQATPTPQPTRTPAPRATPIPEPPPPTVAPTRAPTPPAQSQPSSVSTGSGAGNAKSAEGLLVGATMELDTSHLPSLVLTVIGDRGLSSVNKKSNIRVQVNTPMGAEVFKRGKPNSVESGADGFRIIVRLTGKLWDSRVQPGEKLEVRLWIEEPDTSATFDVKVP